MILILPRAYLAQVPSRWINVYFERRTTSPTNAERSEHATTTSLASLVKVKLVLYQDTVLLSILLAHDKYRLTASHVTR